MNDTRQNILDTTAKLILEKGLDAIRISSIAKGAGLTDGALYRHFESKDVLIAEVYTQVAQEIDSHITLMAQGEGSVKERFLMYWQEPFRYFSHHPERFVLFERLNRAPSVRKPDTMLAQSLELVQQLFSEAKASNHIREDINPVLMTHAIYGIFSQFIHKAYSKETPIGADALGEVLEILWQGMQCEQIV